MKNTAFLLLAVLCILCLSGCGLLSKKPSSSGNSHLPTGKPYTVRGQTYRPYTSAHGFTEVGIASWYGPGFHGKTTANGEKYNQNAMTAAHKLLPFNTNIRVTNMANGRSIVVRINDRGPFVASRVIDLSRRSAEQLGMIQAGTAKVRLEAIETKQPILTPDGNMLGRFYVQIGAFAVENNANNLIQAVKQQGYGGRVVRNANTGLNYVQIGPFPSVDRASDVLGKLRPQYPGLFVVAE